MFANIAEAYEVLSQSQWRAIYDEFGETGLKNGVPGRFDLCYKFSGSSEKIYELFFGSENPYAHTIDSNGLDIPGTIFGKGKGGLTEKRPEPPKNVVVELECSLEELYNGCIKKVVYSRMVLGVDNSFLKPEKTTKEITIKKGFGAETVLEYKGEGNESPTFPSANLIIKINELKHSLYERKGANLFYLHHVNLLEALESVPVTLVIALLSILWIIGNC
jgi:DnaJ-class molecular chaperone